ncbi:MAG: histidine phosphatase family protein [Thermogutta sp.]|nr:histidine phosphatase family protein [Thermogutta sp.]
MILYCVRHGESTYNAEGRVQGQSDVPLSPLGLRQGAALAETLRAKGIEAVFTSPLRRAYQTAELAAAAAKCPIFVDHDLKEIHAGIFQDQLRRDLEAARPDEYRRWIGGDMDYTIPGGESRRQLAERGVAALRRIAAAPYQKAAVIAHGRIFTVTFSALMPHEAHRIPRALQNASITTLEADAATGEFRLLSVNETDHLQTVGLSGCGDL